jgi:hypothetical protein
MTSRASTPKALAISATIGAAALAATAAFAAPAAAAPAAPAPAADGGTGWLRVAHLSPDTKSVDVRVSAVAGGDTVYELDSVGYGAVSEYTDMADGTYTVAMVPAGAADDAEPVISTSVEISQGEASTVAAYGPTDDLEIRTFDDDLATPADGAARIRLIQASTITPKVDVSTSEGTAIARGAEAGSATNYAEVPAGAWTLELEGDDVADSTDVELASGSVSTLFVLDTADGGLTVQSVLDSSAVGEVPVGGMQTGGGGLAGEQSGALAGAGAMRAV